MSEPQGFFQPREDWNGEPVIAMSFDQAANLIDRLQAADVTLIYDPATRALRTGTSYSPAVTVG